MRSFRRVDEGKSGENAETSAPVLNGTMGGRGRGRGSGNNNDDDDERRRVNTNRDGSSSGGVMDNEEHEGKKSQGTQLDEKFSKLYVHNDKGGGSFGGGFGGGFVCVF